MSGKLKLDLRFYPDRGIVDKAQNTQWSIINPDKYDCIQIGTGGIGPSGDGNDPNDTICGLINGCIVYSNDELLFDPKGQDFTIDFWVYPYYNGGKINNIFVNFFDPNPFNVGIYGFGISRSNTDNRMRYTFCSTSDNGVVVLTNGNGQYESYGSLTVPINKWQYFVIERYGNKIYCFVDGVLDYQVTIPGEIPSPGSRNIAFGTGTDSKNNTYAGFDMYRFRYLLGTAYYKGKSHTPPIPSADFNRIIGNNIKTSE